MQDHPSQHSNHTDIVTQKGKFRWNTLTLKQKTVFPLLGSVLLAGLILFALMQRELTAFQENYVHGVVLAKQGEIERAVARSAQEALEKAAIFTELPEVREAYERAHQGRLDIETDADVQQAREILRQALAPALSGFAEIAGEKMQLHFHLPNTRSLVRLWREKQIQRDGVWVDVSDDLSGFRPTVQDVNRTGRPVRGIEVGQGGFVVRGVAPVRAADGRHLGSVEMLANFDAIFQSTADADQTILLYMNADLLSIAGRLRDASRYPVLDGRYVQVSGSPEGVVESLVTTALLDAGRHQTVQTRQGPLALAAFPIHDFRQNTIGVMVFATPTRVIDAGIRRIFTILGVLGAAVLVFIAILNYSIVTRVVSQPVQRLAQHLKCMAEGDFCLMVDPRDTRRGDEIGVLSRATAVLGNSVCNMIAGIATNARTLTASAASLSTISSQTSESVQTLSENTSLVAAAAEQTSASSSSVAANMAETAASLRSIAAATEQMSATIAEIAASSEKARVISSGAQTQATSVSTLMQELGRAAQEIDQVTETITAISSQTNLLALNATIEAARAGVAGKGFAVVAGEIKGLARQTAEATEDIKAKIGGVQASSRRALGDIQKILQVIVEMGDIVSTIAAAIEEQAVVTREVAAGITHASGSVENANTEVGQTAAASRTIAQDIGQVDAAANDIRRADDVVRTSAAELAQLAKQLQDMVGQFKIKTL